MELHPAQSQIASDTHRFRVVNCGRRFGKTYLAVLEMFAFAVAKTDAKVAYVAPTYQQARDIAWNELKKICKPITVKLYEAPRMEIEIKNNVGGTSRLVLRGWESVETMRGQAFDFLVLDEISSYRTFWEDWHEVLRPTLTDKRGHGLFISTPKGFNHFYDLCSLQNTDNDYTTYHYTTYDNPHIPTDEIDKAKEELTENRFAQEYLADFRKTEGLVYKEFDREVHVYNDNEEEFEDISLKKIMVGVDFGYTNPCAILTIGKDYDNTYYVTDEWYTKGKTDAEIADYVASIQHNECYPDPENAGAIKELQNRHVNTRTVKKGKGSVQSGVNTVRELLKSDRLYIHSSCVNLIWELETYSYSEKKTHRNEEENPMKENDHAVDALRYVLSMQGTTYGEDSGVKQYVPNFISKR